MELSRTDAGAVSVKMGSQRIGAVHTLARDPIPARDPLPAFDPDPDPDPAHAIATATATVASDLRRPGIARPSILQANNRGSVATRRRVRPAAQ